MALALALVLVLLQRPLLLRRWCRCIVGAMSGMFGMPERGGGVEAAAEGACGAAGEERGEGREEGRGRW